MKDGLRYAEFVVPIVKAIQEQQQAIEDLKAIVEELIKENQELKAKVSNITQK
jgi:regulator of replication initiation timing